MKKLVTITILTFLPMVGFAKVSDFNAMISENMQAQSQLHNTVRDNVDVTRAVARDSVPEEKVVVVEESGGSYNAPTNKELLTFEKEKQEHKVSQKTQFDRLASELNESEF